jgi:hypothetical protein
MNNCYHKKLGSFLFFCLYTILCFFVFAGCRSKNSTDEKTELVETEAGEVRDDVLESLRASNVTSQLPFSEEVLQRGLLNDVDRTNDYLRHGKGAAAANLGIYLSDLSCLVTLGKGDEARRYFEACLRLSEHIGMKKQFEEAIQFGFNEIIAGDKKLGKSLEDRFKDARNTAEEEEFKKLHASALTGYYIEELYHLAAFIKSHSTVEKADSVFIVAFNTFINQKDELDNLIAYFDHIKLKPQGISVYQELLALQGKFLALDRDRLLQERNTSLLVKDKSVQVIFDSLFSFRKRIIDS